MDAEGLADEAKQVSEIKRSLELTSEHGTEKAADGMAKSVRVGTGTRAMQTQRRKLHELDATSGAESKTVEAMRTGRSPRGARPPEDCKGSPKRETKGVSPGRVKLVKTGRHASPDSKAYQKTMGSLSAELAGSKGEDMPVNDSRRGDEGAAPTAEAMHNSSSKNEQAHPVSPSKREKGEKKSHMLTKAEAVALFEENRKKKMEEDRAYAEAQAERFHRASVSGKNFDTMLRRAERAMEKNKAKLEAKRSAEEEAARKAVEDREAARKAHLNKNLSSAGELSWAEMQEQQENARREAAEKRRQEIAAQSKAPAGAFAKDADKKHRDAAKAAEADTNAFTFKAADPEKVTARLEKQHQVWVRTLESAKERASEKVAQAALATMGKFGKDPAAQMENRAQGLKEKRERRLAEKREKEAKVEEQQLAREKKAREKLFNEKVPESGRRLTKSAQNRAELVRKALEREAREKAMEEKRAAAKAKSEREMSLILKSIVQERDRERKEKLPGAFREISDAQMKEHVKHAQLEYKARLLENKKRLRDAINSRPSLLERHEQDIAARTAGTKALGKVASAMGSEEMDLFDEDEAAKLGVLGV